MTDAISDEDERLERMEAAFREMTGELAARGHRLPGNAQTTADYLVTRAEVVAVLMGNQFDDDDLDADRYRDRIRREVTDDVLSEGMTLIDAALRDETRRTAITSARSPLVRSVLERVGLNGNVLMWRNEPTVSLSAQTRGMHSWSEPPSDDKWRERLSHAINTKLPHGSARLRPEQLEFDGGAYDGFLTVRIGDGFHRNGWRRYMPNPQNAPLRIVVEVAARVADYLTQFEHHRDGIYRLLSDARTTILMAAHAMPGFTIGAIRHGDVTFRRDVDAALSNIHALQMRIEILMLGHHLEVSRQTIDTVVAGTGDVDMHSLNALMDDQRRRQALLEKRGPSSKLAVDPVVARFLAPLSKAHRHALVDLLRVNHGAAMTRRDLVDAAPGLAREVETLQILEGTIIGRIRISPRISWNGGRLSCHRTTLADSLVAGLPGRTLSSLVEHPAIGDLVIREAYGTRKGSLRVTVTNPTVPLSVLD